MSSNHGTAISPCENCHKLVDDSDSAHSIKTVDVDVDISGIGLDDVQIVDAICYVYGISLHEFRTWSGKDKQSTTVDANDVHWLTEDTSVTLCGICAQILSDNYKAHKRFEELSHYSSFVHQINRFRRGLERDTLSEELEVKTEIEVYSEDLRENDADSFCELSSEDFDDVPHSVPETLVPEIGVPETECVPDPGNSKEPEKHLDIISTNTKRKGSTKKVKSTLNSVPVKKSTLDSVPVRRSLRTRKCSVKLKRLSNEELKDPTLALQNKAIEKKTESSEEKTEVTTPNYLECPVCGKKFGVKPRRPFREHVREHYRKRLTEYCKICEKTISRGKLKPHMQKVHINSEEREKQKVPCEICGKLLTVDSLKSHIKHIHSQSEEFKCGTCGKSFLRKNFYEAHLLTHSEQYTPHLCGQCGKTFKCKYSMAKHEQIHLNKKFACEVCGKEFPIKSYMRRHLKEAHNVIEKSFVCEECGKSYKFKRHLLEHQRTHKEGPNPIVQCDQCGINFKNNLSLKKHTIRDHQSVLSTKDNENLDHQKEKNHGNI